MDEGDSYGKLVSSEDAELMDGPAGWPQAEQPAISDEGNALWSYREEHRINGVPVDASAQGLKIDDERMLSVAFRLDRRPCSAVMYVSPGSDGSAEYDALLDRVYRGEAVIVDEMRQFDAASGRFIAWIRYDEIRYVLHPRFNYLLEE